MRGKTLYILWASVFFAIAFSVLTAHASDPYRITAEEALSKLHTATFIDARTGKDWDYSKHKITGAQRGTYGNEQVWATPLPKDSEIIIYCACPNELTSSGVVRTLTDMGFSNVKALIGGWFRWQKNGYPVEDK